MNNKPKHILYKEMAREKLQSGVNQLANTVVSTIGPKGRNVILDREFGSPLITNDGVSIAREIELADPFENMGAKIIKEATNEKKVIETKEEPKKEVTLIDVRTALAKLSKEGYTNDVKALLNKYGAEKLSAVNPNDYEAILKDAEVLNNGK